MSESPLQRHLRTLAQFRRPLRALLEGQQTAQRVLSGVPLSDIARFQRYAREAGWPLQAIAGNQQVVLSTTESLAAQDPWAVAAATPDVSLTAAEEAWQEQAGRWLVDFVEAVVELRPSKAQLWTLINVATFLISVLLFLSAYTNVDVPEAQLIGAGLLLQGGAALYRFAEDADPEK